MGYERDGTAVGDQMIQHHLPVRGEKLFRGMDLLGEALFCENPRRLARALVGAGKDTDGIVLQKFAEDARTFSCLTHALRRQGTIFIGDIFCLRLRFAVTHKDDVHRWPPW